MSAKLSQLVDPQDLTPIDEYQFTGDDYTVLRKRSLIEAYREHGSIYHAAIVARVSRKTVYNWMEVDEEFSTAVADSKEDCSDKVETSVYKKAIAGSTLDAIFYLKAKRPEFRDRLQVNLDELREQIRERMANLNAIPVEASELLQIPSESESKQKD